VSKLSELPVTASVSANDKIVVLSGGAAKTAAVSTVVRVSNSAPANSSAGGTAGDLAYDGGYLYVCVSANTWVRSELLTW
jgi:hypothetical protein